MMFTPDAHAAPCSPEKNADSQTWTFHILTFGCKVNQYESQSLREAWQSLGGIEVQDVAQAQVTLINSCAITARAVRESRNALYRLARENPQGLRILTGCSATLVDTKAHDRPAKKAAGAAVVDGTLLHVMVPAVRKYLLLQGPWPILAQEEAQPNATSDTSMPPAATPASPVYPPFSISAYRRARPVLKVQDGCSHRCTYCIVPLVRGGASSRPQQAVVDEARRLLQAGHCEIMISGINLSQYASGDRGSKKSRSDFWALVLLLEKALAPEWAGRARFRISSLEPGQLQAEGLETLTSCRMLCPHLHISLQSGSPAILRRMGRGHYSPLALVEALRVVQQHWPHMGLGADILMGFPGEEAEHVAETLAIVESLPLTYAHVFPYSRRPNTPAADFPLQVPHQEKLRRSAQVRSAVDAKHQAFLHTMLQVPVSQLILDGANTHKGVNEYYVQCHLKGGCPQEGAGILRVRPVGIEQDALLVEPVA